MKGRKKLMKVREVCMDCRTAFLTTVEALFMLAGLTLLAAAWRGTAPAGETAVEMVISFVLGWLPAGMPPI